MYLSIKSTISKLAVSAIVFLLLFAAAANVQSVYAQTYKLELENPSAPVCTNTDFKVKILINTNNVDTNNGDTLITFDPAKLTVKSASTGNFYTYFSDSGLLGGYTNKYLVDSWEESAAHTKKSSTDTLFATLNLNAKAEGSTSLALDCAPNTGSDSNINRASDSVDILNCSALQPLSFNITSCGATSAVTPTVTLVPSATPVPPTPTAVAPTSTPRPTALPAATNTPKPQVTALPRAGAAEMTVAFLGIGGLLTIVGLLFIL